jgi:hypothetical protein
MAVAEKRLVFRNFYLSAIDHEIEGILSQSAHPPLAWNTLQGGFMAPLLALLVRAVAGPPKKGQVKVEGKSA